jgi:hypothetical protein
MSPQRKIAVNNVLRIQVQADRPPGQGFFDLTSISRTGSP